ncbi:MAG: tRNA epoxyqueuosine(34) reductase QueG [Flavobacteriales bacterium TMED123]|nr:MAG: tRNA epoxyqueuosine(34) reductase QueG [Flavobacteriales bacterium TMED123]|tara:strand:+ start:4751 stop:5695 length:945 start_codon:yes stop_codon:yes gene_type:complete
MSIKHNTTILKTKAKELGFTFCTIAKADFLHKEALQLERWLAKDNHGEMTYMEKHFDKRLDPRLLVKGAKSVISLAYNYYTPKKQTDKDAPKISIYAYGKDYHKVVKKKLQSLFHYLQEEIGEINGRYFVDSAPVMEKAWAEKSGLGWIGKNANLITKSQGSYFFLAEIIVDIPLMYDTPIKDYCGSCTKCIDACPTDAITEPYVVDGSKCISYFTIELKDAIPNEMKGKFDNWMFGCDICQIVCPWNSFSLQHNEEKFFAKTELLSLKKDDWETLGVEKFDEIFEGSAVKRAGYNGLKRNIEFLMKSDQTPLE